ncbi:MAG: hypothetical protein AB7J37_05880 [Candidatus Melainabacteria bacterium]
MSVYFTPSHSPFFKRNATHPLRVVTLPTGQTPVSWALMTQSLATFLVQFSGLALCAAVLVLVCPGLADWAAASVPTPTSDTVVSQQGVSARRVSQLHLQGAVSQVKVPPKGVL